MARQIFQFLENVSGDIQVGVSTITLEIFHIFTNCTAAGTSTTTIPFAERAGFENGDQLYIGTNASVTISDGSLPTTGAGNVTVDTSISFSDLDPIVIHTNTGAVTGRADFYEEQIFATTITQPVTADSDNEVRGFLKPGSYALRWAVGSTTQAIEYKHVVLLRHVNVRDYGAIGDDSTDDTVAFQAAIDEIGTRGGGTVYVPDGTFRVTTITISTPNVDLAGAGVVATFVRGTALTGNVIDVTAQNDVSITDMNVNATSGRTAVATTAYSDGNPTDGKHGILFKPSSSATTQFRCRVVNVTIQNQPDDGLVAEQPEHLTLDTVHCTDGGRFGIHINGQANGKGTSNNLINTRAISNANHGYQIRGVTETLLVHPQGLLNSGTFQIYLWGGRSNSVIDCDVESTAFNTNTGIQVVGSFHRIAGGTIQKFKTPIGLSVATNCVFDHTHVTNLGVTAADQVYNIPSGSDNNLFLLSPLASYTNVTAVVTEAAGAVGNIFIGSDEGIKAELLVHGTIQTFTDADAAE